MLHHNFLYPEAKVNQISQKSSVWSLKQDYYSSSSELCQHLSSSIHFDWSWILPLRIKEASTWLTALPLMSVILHCITLFSECSCMSYTIVGFALLHFVLVEHSSPLSMLHLGLQHWATWVPLIRCNEIRDLTATLLTKVYSQVTTELTRVAASFPGGTFCSLLTYRMVPGWI